MKRLNRLCVFLLFCCGCYSQAPQALATPDELRYFRFMLMNLASLDHHQDAVKRFEESLVKQFGLNKQESATIHAVAQRLNVLLMQLRQSSQSMLRGKSDLSGADAAALSALSTQRDQFIDSLSNEILNSVRPETAARLRAPGHHLAAGVMKSQSGK
jgi:hypothetical protein